MTEGRRSNTCAQIAEDFRRVGDDIRRLVRNMGPSSAASAHFRTARVEFWKGVRQVIDDRIETISSKPPRGTAGAEGAKVTVE